MTVTNFNIVPAKQAENTQTTQYTVSNGKLIVDKFTVTNTTNATHQFSCNIVSESGSASNANLIIDTKSISPSKTYSCPEMIGQVIEKGGFISTLASSASSLTIAISGRIIE